MTSLTLLIILTGASTVLLSIYVAGRFYKHQRKMQGDSKALTGALMYQLVGEAVIGLGTLAFAVAAHTGHLPSISIEIQSALRLLMFMATSFTTWHLCCTINFIRDHD